MGKLKEVVNLTDSINTFRVKVNTISDDVGSTIDLVTAETNTIVGAINELDDDINGPGGGDPSVDLTTTATNLVAAINEHDSELGLITAAAMGTDNGGGASTVSTAINELDGRLDYIRDVELITPRLTATDVAGTSIFNGDVHMDLDLQVDGDLTVGGNIELTGNITIGGTSNVGDTNTDNVVFAADINSNFIPDLDGTYDLGSASQEWRNLYIDGIAYIDTLTVDENATVAGTLGVTGATTLSSTLNVTGATIMSSTVNIDGNVDIDAALDVLNTVTMQSNATVGGTLGVTGVTTLSNAVNIDGNVDIDAALDVLNATTLQSTLGVTGATTLSSTLGVTGITTLGNNLIVNGSSDLNGTLDVLNGTNLQSTLTVAGLVDINNSADILNNLNIGGTLTAAGATDLNSTLNVEGATILQSTLNGQGAADFDSTVNIDGELTIGGGLVLSAAATEVFQDVIGGMVTSNTESGIVVTYNDPVTPDGTGKLNFDVGDFTITAGGDITGSVTITDLASATFNMEVNDNSHNHLFANISDGQESVEDIVGAMVSSNTELGISVTYNDTDGKLNFNVNDPVISLTGDVVGSATMTNLGNVAIATTIQPDSVALGTDTTGNYMVDVAAGTGIVVTHTQAEGSTATVAHADTSDQASVNNSEGNVIQDVTLDTFGHVTGLVSVDLDERYYTETEADNRFVNVTGDTITGSLTIETDLQVDGEFSVGGDFVIQGTQSNATGTIELLTGQASPLADAELLVDRGEVATVVQPKAQLLWDESEDYWSIGTTADSEKILRENDPISVTTVTTSSNASVGGTLGVTGATTLSSTLNVTGNTVIGGNLTVNGTTTTVNTEEINLADNIILLNSNLDSGTDPTENAGIEINRGTGPNVSLIWHETDDVWDFGGEEVRAQDYNTLSDIRLKTNVEDLSGSLDKVKALRGVSFDWRENPSDTKTIGFIAQEVEQILPEVVETSVADGIKTVKYANVVALLVEAMKEQQKMIEELQAKLGM